MKTLITILFIVMLALSCNAQIRAIVTFEEDTTAVIYHIFVWEGNAVAGTPFIEDSNYIYIQSVADTHFAITETTFEFDTKPNGNHIQLAGFNENSFGLMAGATLSNMVLKPNEANKMEFIFLEIGVSDIADTNFIGMSFSEPMDNEGLYDINKYEVVGNSGDTLDIYEILYMPNTNYESVVIVTNSFSKNSFEYVITVNNVSDKAGNLINQGKNFAVINMGNR